MPIKPEATRTLIHRVADIPNFATDAEERLFWETHEVSDELAAAAEPLPGDIATLLDRVRGRRMRRKAPTP